MAKEAVMDVSSGCILSCGNLYGRGGSSTATTSIDNRVPRYFDKFHIHSLNNPAQNNVDLDAEDLLLGNSEPESSTPCTPSHTRPRTSDTQNTTDTPNTYDNRALLYDKLMYHMQDKLKKTQSIDNQLLICAQEDTKVKKQLLDKLDNMDRKCFKIMERVSSNIEKFTNCLTDFSPNTRKTKCIISSNNSPSNQVHNMSLTNQLTQQCIP